MYNEQCAMDNATHIVILNLFQNLVLRFPFGFAIRMN